MIIKNQIVNFAAGPMKRSVHKINGKYYVRLSKFWGVYRVERSKLAGDVWNSVDGVGANFPRIK